MLLLRPDELQDILTFEEAIDAVEASFREWNLNPELSGPRQRLYSPERVRSSVHPGVAPSLQALGVKIHVEKLDHNEERQFIVGRGHPVMAVYNGSSAKLECVLLGDIFSGHIDIRTSAITAMGIKHTAREDAKILGLFGTGKQARNHLFALKTVRPIQEAKIYSRSKENRERFARELEREAGMPVRPLESPDAVVQGSDIVCAATSSSVPVFNGKLLEQGQTVTSIVGSNIGLVRGGFIKERRRELDDETVVRADRIVVTTKEQMEHDRQVDVYSQAERGMIRWEDVIELTHVLNGVKPGRANDREVVLFKNNVGLGIADIALGKRAYQKARERGLGIEIELPKHEVM